MSPSIAKPKIPQVYGSLTDVGNVREHNEDSFVAQPPLFAVADGMGGHEAGEVASAIAIDTLVENMPDSPSADMLATAVKKANLAVMRGAETGAGKPGMGTTMTAAVVYGDELVVAQVGDSRAYLLHDGALQRVTRDHSLVADYVAQGRITEEEARYHPQRSVITRALGSDPGMEPDTYSLRVEAGDRLLLCSDGLSSMVEDSGIASILAAHDDPQRCCAELVSEALAAGGLDNVTAVVVDPLRKESDLEATITPEQVKAEKHKRRFAPLIWAIVFVAVLAVAGIGFAAFVQNSYFVQAVDGHVNIYKGLPGDIAGAKVSWLEEEVVDIDVSKLAPTTANRLESGISVDNMDKAHELIESYRTQIAGTADPAQQQEAQAGAQAQGQAAGSADASAQQGAPSGAPSQG